MAFEYTTLQVAGQPDMKLVVYTPLDADGSTRKLQALLRGRPSRESGRSRPQIF
jgi:hypothetical protein